MVLVISGSTAKQQQQHQYHCQHHQQSSTSKATFNAAADATTSLSSCMVPHSHSLAALMSLSTGKISDNTASNCASQDSGTPFPTPSLRAMTRSPSCDQVVSTSVVRGSMTMSLTMTVTPALPSLGFSKPQSLQRKRDPQCPRHSQPMLVCWTPLAGVAAL